MKIHETQWKNWGLLLRGGGRCYIITFDASRWGNRYPTIGSQMLKIAKNLIKFHFIINAKTSSALLLYHWPNLSI